MTEKGLEMAEARDAARALRPARPKRIRGMTQQRLRAHKFSRPFRLPNPSCVCGEKFSAPEDMGIFRQRDFVLDMFNTHLAAVRARGK